MEFLIPLMPLFGALPLAVAAIVIAKMWQRRRDVPFADLQAQNEELRADLDTLRQQLTETQDRLDFTERVLTQQRRAGPLPAAEEDRGPTSG
jgi:hypothetical protein